MGVLRHPLFKPDMKTNNNSENKNIIYLYKVKAIMRTLNLHTECYQPMSKTWAGISVFNSLRIK